MEYYVALLENDGGNEYGVVFPDFPGCVTQGDSYEQALQLAAEVLAFHVEGMQADGLPVPQPRSIEQIRAAAEDWYDLAGSVVAMIPLLPAPEGKPQPTNLSLDAGLVKAVDQYADAQKLTRSAVFAEGAKLLMKTRPVAIESQKLQGRIHISGSDGKIRTKSHISRDAKTGEFVISREEPNAGRDLPIRNKRPAKR
jgi:predicted RNase H-like HicB family nuclease